MISIVILTHNSDVFIENCLESILRQKDQDTEIIVVDNASEDKTREILSRYSKQADIIANKQNQGPCCGRNQAISKAKGEWILTLDCDVVLDADFMKNFKQSIADIDPQVGMLRWIFGCAQHLIFWRASFFPGAARQS